MEGDTIIISENDVLNQPPGTDKLEYPIKTDGRTVRIAHIYVHTRVLVNRCFQICGIDLFNVRGRAVVQLIFVFLIFIPQHHQVPVLFDGVQFHNLMDQHVQNGDAFEVKKSEISGFQIDAF